MKALKSSNAKQVLADEKGRTQLRNLITSSETLARKNASGSITLRDKNGQVRTFKPVIVPKAEAA